MKRKSIVAVLALVLHTGVSAHNIEELLDGIAKLPAENVTASYTMQMPLMEEDVEYTLTFSGDSITATPLIDMPAKTQAISDSPFGAFHPATIASTIGGKVRDKGYDITHGESDGKVTIAIERREGDIVGSTARYDFDSDTLRPITIRIVNNPASLTEQTITITYIYNK